MKVTIDIELDAAELMSSVFDNLWQSSSPWVIKTQWDFEHPLARRVPVCYENPDEGDVWKYTHVGPEDLKQGFELMIKAQQRHCGELVSTNLDEWDACCADECLQYTIFGKSIYG